MRLFSVLWGLRFIKIDNLVWRNSRLASLEFSRAYMGREERRGSKREVSYNNIIIIKWDVLFSHVKTKQTQNYQARIMNLI